MAIVKETEYKKTGAGLSLMEKGVIPHRETATTITGATVGSFPIPYKGEKKPAIALAKGVCPDCGKSCGTAMCLSAHRKSKHAH